MSELNYHTTKLFTENLLVIEIMRKTGILMNKPIYLGLSILDLSKTVMYQFLYDYVKTILRNTFLGWWIMQLLEKLRKMWENIEILNLQQKKGEETIYCENQIIILKSFS